MPVAGHQLYYNRSAESTWGTLEGTPGYVAIPVTSSSIVANLQTIQSPIFTGNRQRKHSQSSRVTVGGQIAMPFWGQHVTDGLGSPTIKSLSEWMIGDAVSAASGLDLNAFTWEEATNDIDNKRYLGCRINSMTIEGDAESNLVNLSFDVIAKQESGGITEQALSATAALPIAALFSDCTFAYGGSTIKLKKFSLVLNNNLQAEFLNADTIDYLSAGNREWDYNFDIIKTANTYDALRRAATTTTATAQLVIKARHGGTAANTFTVATIDVDVAHFVGAGDTKDLNKLMQQSNQFKIVKPNTSDADVTFTWSTSA